MADRFFCADLSQPLATLSTAEAHHAIHVLRIASGQAINLFDGRGTTAEGVVQKVDRRSVTVLVEARVFTERSKFGTVTIAAATPRGDRIKWMVEKLTELGVDRYVPLITERSVSEPGKSKLDKLQATIVEASKQCGRNWLMEIGTPTTLKSLVSDLTDGTSLSISHPYEIEAEVSLPTEKEVNSHMILIGPEGGFTEAEVEFAVGAGAARLCWPNSILRVETAAITAAVLVGQTRSAT